jgi:hypothetical protein
MGVTLIQSDTYPCKVYSLILSQNHRQVFPDRSDRSDRSDRYARAAPQLGAKAPHWGDWEGPGISTEFLCMSNRANRWSP